ncbi:MaoC/PaaZ C-terminal domain-containing protein [Corynebacterium kozikiae]|uniref:MaoC/PaaZ C-terminal domain-containing protein n=1 Tax=Corynebacterium kozikiae TaxID=2968469 RepID=UPI00211BA127|nr:MaoC/PaaZ C-terminal domain-containing protein [Corynebacterium sp. 76QC2CO]MCQ9344071.1 MaoC/PaaZ C-terminal domain-containing protein [Corynebacterium sp. 76QC2CO]
MGEHIQYTQLPKIPELSKLYRRVALDRVPVLGTTRHAVADPTSGAEVSGIRVSPEHLAHYNQAVGLRNTNELPITYPFVLGFPLAIQVMSAKDFPFPAMGAVHISNQIEQRHPIGIDQEFSLSVHAENLRSHRKGLLIDVITHLTLAGEQDPAWVQTSTFLGLGAKLASSASADIVNRGEQRGTRLDTPTLPKRQVQTALWRITRDQINAYAAASGDKNPVHTSVAGAKLFGFPNVIAHGMFSAAKMLTLLEGRMGASERAVRFTLDFAAPVVLPARVQCWALRTGAEEQTWELQLRKAKNPDKLHAHAILEEFAWPS